MIIQCDKCNTRFRLDDSRVTGGGVKVRCTKCQNVFIVTPPPIEEVAVEEIIGAGAQESSRRAEPASKANLKFDFAKKASSDLAAEKDSPSPSPAGMDFSFGVSEADADEKEPEKTAPSPGGLGIDNGFSAPGPGAGDGGRDNGDTDDDLDFKFDEEDEAFGNNMRDEQNSGAQASSAAPPADDEEDLAEPGAGGAVQKEQVLAQGANGRAAAGDANNGRDRFADVLTKSLSDASSRIPNPSPTNTPGFDGRFNTPKRNPGKGRSRLVIALGVLLIGVAAIYFSGILDTLTRGIVPAQEASVKETILIETVTGSYAENRNFGRLFIIQARVKNTSDAEQEIIGVTGVLYNDRGEKIATRSVSPGRVLTLEDIKNLPKADLLKAFKDPAGGTIPARGTAPVMVLFTEVPRDLAEFGIDIVR